MTGKDQRTPIVPPKTDINRKMTRAIVEALVGLIPRASALVRLYQTTHPPRSEIERDAWQGAISERSNEHSDDLERHEEILAPKEEITGVAAQLLQTLGRKCTDGLGRSKYSLDDLCVMLPEADRDQIRDAAYDLKRIGLVELVVFIGGEWRLSLTPRFYEQIDPQVMDWSVGEDSKTLAKLMLQSGEGRAAPLHEASGWERRRFNPAFRYLVGLFPAGHVSQERSAMYPVSGVLLLPDGLAALRRHIS